MHPTKLAGRASWFTVNLIMLTSLVFGLLAYASAPVQAASPNLWEYQNPFPQSGTLNGVNGTASDDVFAVGKNGSIIHYNGSAWTKMDSGTTLELYNVWCVPGSDPIVVGDDGLILRYHDSSWIPMLNSGYAPIKAISGTSVSDLMAIDMEGFLLRYDGNPDNIWTMTDLGIDENITGIWKASTQYFAVGSRRSIYNSIDGGLTWNKMTLPSTITSNLTGTAYFNAIWGISDTDVYAVGTDSGNTNDMNSFVLHYDGSDWSIFFSENGDGIFSLWGTAADNFFCGSSQQILHYDGDWHSIYVEPDMLGNYIYGLWGVSTSDIYAVGGGGTLLHSTDNGSSWSSLVSSLTTSTLQAVWGSSQNDLYCVGEGGKILHSADAGDTWVVMDENNFRFLNDVWGSSADNVFAVGSTLEFSVNNSLILRSTNGINWNPLDVSSLPQSFLYSIWGSSSNDIFTVGRDSDNNTSLILHSVDNVTWNRMPDSSFPDIVLNDVWGLSSDCVFAVGHYYSDYDGVGLFYDGSIWTQIEFGDLSSVGALRSAWGASPDDVFVVGALGGILHYDGSTWSEMEGTDYNGGLNAIWGFSHSDIFASGSEMLHYNGTAWTPIESGSGAELNGLWGTSFGNLYAAGYYGTIIHGILHQDVLNGGSALIPANESSFFVDLDNQQSSSFSVSELASQAELDIHGMGTPDVQGFRRILRITTDAPDGTFTALVQYHYTDAEVAFSGLKEEDLRLYFYDVNQYEWIFAVDGNTTGTALWMGSGPAPLAPAPADLGKHGIDMDNNILWAVVDHATDFTGGIMPIPYIFIFAENNFVFSGDSHDFGSHPVGSDNQTSFELANVGNDGLKIRLPLTLSGPDASQFRVVEQPESALVSGDLTAFTVAFCPTSPGNKSAVLNIESNDFFRKPFVINLTGQATGSGRIQGVGGEVAGIDRLGLPAPWFILGGILVGSGVIVIARRRKSACTK